jgi:2-hydroxychromene-2-carboxylate isomerase
VPVLAPPAYHCAEEIERVKEDVERGAAALGLQPVRWPDPFPFDSERAMLAATYAKSIGRAVAFSLAAFRQAYAGGRPLDDDDTILIAAAACEMHPRAVLKALETQGVREALEEATAG